MTLIQRVGVSACGDDDLGAGDTVEGGGQQQCGAALFVARFDVCPCSQSERTASASPRSTARSSAASGSSGAFESVSVDRMRSRPAYPRSRAISRGVGPVEGDRSSSRTPPVARTRTVVAYSGVSAPSQTASWMAWNPMRFTWSRSMPARSSSPTTRAWLRSAARMRPVPFQLSLSLIRAPWPQGQSEELQVALAGGDEIGRLLGVVLGVDVGSSTHQPTGTRYVVVPGGVATSGVRAWVAVVASPCCWSWLDPAVHALTVVTRTTATTCGTKRGVGRDDRADRRSLVESACGRIMRRGSRWAAWRAVCIVAGAGAGIELELARQIDHFPRLIEQRATDGRERRFTVGRPLAGRRCGLGRPARPSTTASSGSGYRGTSKPSWRSATDGKTARSDWTPATSTDLPHHPAADLTSGHREGG